LIFTLPSDYPNSVPKIELYPFGLRLHQSTIDFLLEDLNQEASTHLGQAMIYDLVDFMRDKLVNLENDISLGDIFILPDETILYISSFLNIQCLGILLQVSISFNKLVNRPSVWKERYFNLCSYKERVKHDKDKDQNWKRKCLSKSRFIQNDDSDFNYKYLISIMDRIGTGDSWIGSNWQENFITEFQKSAKVILQSYLDPYEGKILNSTDKSLIGTYKLMMPSYIQSVFRSKNWFNRRSNMNIYNCRYLGDEKGWCAFTLYSSVHNQRVMTSLIQICRGIFKQVSDQYDPGTACVIYYPVWINYGLGIKNNKPVILHASINSNITPHTIQPLSIIGSPTSYSRYINASLIKLSSPVNKHINIITESMCKVWLWMISTVLAENIDQYKYKNMDSTWEELKTPEPPAPYFLEQMYKKTDQNKK